MYYILCSLVAFSLKTISNTRNQVKTDLCRNIILTFNMVRNLEIRKLHLSKKGTSQTNLAIQPRVAFRFWIETISENRNWEFCRNRFLDEVRNLEIALIEKMGNLKYIQPRVVFSLLKRLILQRVSNFRFLIWFQKLKFFIIRVKRLFRVSNFQFLIQMLTFILQHVSN